jgi:alanyl-tRNA synthetase
VIADHLRSTSFLLADGVLPSNEGRGYVLRRIMRRAMRHAHLLGAKQPLMHRLVPALVAEMGAAYPELGRAQPLIQDVLEREETKFRQTLDKGLKLLDEATENLVEGGTLPGETAFRLYDTYGFPYDLTEDALRSRGIAVDKDGFDSAMAQQKAAARAAWKGSGEAAAGEVWFDIAERIGATEFTGYTSTTGEAQITAILKDGKEVESAAAGDAVTILTNQTPFYGESGGQMGDAGTITGADGLKIAIADTSKPLGRLHAHSGTVESGTVKVGDAVALAIDVARRDAIAPITRPRICCMPRCATVWAAMSRRRARWSRRIVCVSTSRSPRR